MALGNEAQMPTFDRTNLEDECICVSSMEADAKRISVVFFSNARPKAFSKPELVMFFDICKMTTSGFATNDALIVC